MYQPNTMHCILCSTVPQPQRLIIVRALYRARQKAERALERNKNIYLSVCFGKDDKEIYTVPAIQERILVTPKFNGRKDIERLRICFAMRGGSGEVLLTPITFLGSQWAKSRFYGGGGIKTHFLKSVHGYY